MYKMSSSVSVVIFSRGAGAQQYGLGQDAKILEVALRELAATGKSRVLVTHKDPYTFVGKEKPSYSDVHIYLEVPCRAAFPWAKTNVIIPNPEWWFKDEWSWVLEDPSVTFLHKSQHSLSLFGKGEFIGWRCPAISGSFTEKKKLNQTLYVVGGSKSKMLALDKIVEMWSPEYNNLIVVSQIAGIAKPNIIWKTGYLSSDELRVLQEESKYHIVASACEGFGYTMAEALNFGAKVLWTDIPVYKELWQDLLVDSGMIATTVNSNTDVSGSLVTLDKGNSFSSESFIKAMSTIDQQAGEKAGPYIMNMNKAFRQNFNIAWSKIVVSLAKKKQTLLKIPPVIPSIGVVTLVKNRPGWFPNAVRNIEHADYPRDKLIWVIVDDGDADKRVDTFINQAKLKLPDLKISYVSLPRALHIGEKRNRGVKQAILDFPEVSLLAFMDDDDHYPNGSLVSRMAWIESFKCGAVYCSTLPMYDTTHYISAMNVPPLDLAPRRRISEATLCFRRSFWEERGFPGKVSVAEGEEFLLGRELQTLEIPPNGVIVSFLHGKNFTSRRVPDTDKPNGCHYGFSDEYFSMISQLGNATA